MRWSPSNALSRAGLNVLLVERGGWAKRDETDWNGRAILLDGRYKGEAPLGVRQYGARAAIDSFPNEVVGGNSIFFGGAALRLRAADFARWPVGYAAFEPYYAAAEALLEVHGRAGDDPASRRAPATTRARPRRSPRPPGASPTPLARSACIRSRSRSRSTTAARASPAASTASPATAFPAVSAPRTT